MKLRPNRVVDTPGWSATESRKKEELNIQHAEDTISTNMEETSKQPEENRIFGDGSRRLLRARDKERAKEEVSRVRVIIVGSTDIRRHIVPNPELVRAEETEEEERVRGKEDSKALVGLVGSSDTLGTVAQMGRVQKVPERVEERAAGKEQVGGTAKGKGLVSKIIGRESK